MPNRTPLLISESVILVRAWTRGSARTRILLIIAGGIAAYKSLELIRRLRERGVRVRCVLTAAGAAVRHPARGRERSRARRSISDLFSLTDESEMGHIRLSREADLVVVAPATADLIAKMAGGLADDLASTALLATDKPVLIAPAMNARMWQHPATRRNLARLAADGVRRVGPNPGDMACGETGVGRMAEPAEILAAIETLLMPAAGTARRPPRVGHQRSHASRRSIRCASSPIARRASRATRSPAALAAAGAEVTLVSGPVHEPDPAGVKVVRVRRRTRCWPPAGRRCRSTVAVCAAAVADWRAAEPRAQKLKRRPGRPPTLVLAENPDILKTLARAGPNRPPLVVGFAAETEDLEANAHRKLAAKGCDWIVANDVSMDEGTFGSVYNTVKLIRADAEPEAWPRMSKAEVASRLVACIAAHLRNTSAVAA